MLGSLSFINRCEQLEINNHNFSPLVMKIKQLGMGGNNTTSITTGGHNNTRGHVLQSIGASQVFLQEYPQHKTTIQQSPADRPFDIRNNNLVLEDWLLFLDSHHGSYQNEFNYDTLRNCLPANLGGMQTTGGGAGDEFKHILRLAAEIV